MKVLIADDFEIMRHVIKKSLGALGHEDTVQAIDGNDAIEKMDAAALSEKPFDLIICDWNMPFLSGLEILERVRNTYPYTKTPFVMITAEAEAESIVRAVKMGANDYITKPITVEDLTVKLKKIFERLNLK